MRFAVTETLTRWLDDHPDIPLGVGTQPYKEDGGPANPSWVGGWAIGIAIGIMSGTKEPDLAWEFIKFLAADPQGSAILSGPARWIPAYLESEIIPQYLEDPYLQPYLRMAATAQFHRPVMPLSSDYGDGLGPGLCRRDERSQPAPRRPGLRDAAHPVGARHRPGPGINRLPILPAEDEHTVAGAGSAAAPVLYRRTGHKGLSHAEANASPDGKQTRQGGRHARCRS